MKVSYVLLISLLIVGALFVPAVSADEIIINELLYDGVDTSSTGKIYTLGHMGSTTYFNKVHFRHMEKYGDLSYLSFMGPGNQAYSSPGTPIPDGKYNFTYTIDGVTRDGVAYISRSTNLLGTVTSTRTILFFYDWDNTGMSGLKTATLSFYPVKAPDGYGVPLQGTPEIYVSDASGEYPGRDGGIKYAVASATVWSNELKVVKTANAGYNIQLSRTPDTKPYPSTLFLNKAGETVFTNYDTSGLLELWRPQNEIDEILVTTFTGKEFLYLLDSPDPGDDPGETPTLRTGTVTMTDHNGTSITGFEVTAINAYTGQSYTVVTETDVAVMTLPMDRTIEIRNPQTGVYEDVPIGYYLFYGQAPGYKMVHEDGIQVSVRPEKYSSYELCDILVTSESGPLTGKHQFQIRSRSDNSILQTGTISAKSATTGEWFNTTVSGGLASLILPYDTSNPKSQYAGNYYVYATSPGYEDSDYGTQIVVMPHTVSEIHSIQLTPIGGVPTAGNVTLRIQAISETGPGVVNAEIFIAGVLGEGYSVWDTYTASSTGYLSVSVPGNSTYDIVASGAGYYDSARRIEVFTDDPDLIEMRLYLSGYPTLEPITEPTGWPTGPPATQPPGGIPDDDDDSDGFLVQAVRGIGLAFGVGFSTAKLIFGMLLALAIGFTTAKQLRGGAAEFGIGLLGGTMLGVLIGLLPVWIIVVLLLVVGLYIGNRYVGGANNG